MGRVCSWVSGLEQMEGVTAVTHSRGQMESGGLEVDELRVVAVMGLAQPLGGRIHLGETGKVNTGTSVEEASTCFRSISVLQKRMLAKRNTE